MTGGRSGYGPRGLAAIMPAVGKRWFRRRGFAEAGLLLDWKTVVGNEIAQFTCPERLDRKGTLHLRVSGAFGVELIHLEPVVIERINSYLGHRAVRRLSLLQGPLPRRPGPRRSPIRPLAPKEEAELRCRLEATTDTGLHAALERLGRSVLAGRPRTVADENEP